MLSVPESIRALRALSKRRQAERADRRREANRKKARRRLRTELCEERVLLASDLVPIAFSGWANPIVVSSNPGDRTDDPITVADTIYFDFGWANLGNTSTGGSYAVEGRLDGNIIAFNSAIPDTASSSGFSFSDITGGPLSAGDHTVTFEVDVNGEIAEDDETNNLFSRTFTVTAVGTEDFGDAPTAAQSNFVASYPTTLADDGARHTPLAGFHLGTEIDVEADGIPSPGADSDDQFDIDDEDGVELTSTLTLGATATAEVFVTNTAGVSNPWGDAWIDFNHDGDWDDAGEQVFSGPLVSGINNVNISVPGSALPGVTYARLRLHDGTTALAPTGAAPDGEVEDYLVQISTPGVWVDQGPAPTINGQLESGTQPDRRVTGAIHTVLTHPTNADIAYIGGVNGGIWRTNDFTSSNPTWTPQTDFLESLAIGAMAFDPTDPTFQTLVAGTAKYSSFGGLGGIRGPVYRTTDGGANWVQLASNGLRIVGENISGIAARGDEIVVSSAVNFGGIFRSTDGGVNFNPISTAGFVSPNDNFTDLVEDPTNPNRLYTTSPGVGGSSGVYRSDDFGATWTQIAGGGSSEIDDLIARANNIEMAVSPQTGRLYIATLVSSQPQGVFYSSNPTTGTPTWTRMDVPVLPIGGGSAISGASNAGPIVITSSGHGLSSGNFVVVDGVTGNTAANGFHRITRIDINTFSLDNSTGNGAYAGGGTWNRVTGPNPKAKDIEETGAQGRIHFSIAVDPTDEDIVYIGGDRQDQPNVIGDSTFGGAVFRGDAGIARNPNVAPSPQWDHATHDFVPSIDANGGTANGTAPHADSREIVFDANGNLVEVDDGGIFIRTSPRDRNGDWFSKAGTLGVIEFHDVAYDSTSDIIMGGTQDNGTHFQQTPGGKVWDFLSGGDGGDIVIDTVSLAGSNQSIRYSSSQNLGSFRRTTWDANNTLLSQTFPSRTVTSGAAFSPQFKTPVQLNAADPSRLLFVGSNGIYESSDMGNTLQQVTSSSSGFLQDGVDFGGFQGGTPNADVFYVAQRDDIFVRTAPGVVTQTDPDPGSDDINDVVMNTTDWANAFAVDDNQVFQTIDAGANWTDITGSLMSIAGAALQTVAFVPGPVGALVVGANQGVFVSTMDALGTWAEVGANLPNAMVFDLIYNATDDVLLAGTLGRGAWTFPNASALLASSSPPPEVVINEIHYNNAGTDTGEFIEVFGPAGTDLSTLELVLYNGTNGEVYDTMALSGTIDDEGSGFGAIAFTYPSNGIQNGAPDGMALVHNGTDVIEFLSYQGEFTATNGPAAGLTSVDIGVEQTGSTPIGLTLQRDNLVLPPSNTWTGPAAHTQGSLNVPITTLDFGDAPDATQSSFVGTYPVTLAEDGARHANVAGPTLGINVDYETDGAHSVDADADDLAGVDDEDGIIIPSPILALTVSPQLGVIEVNLQNADPSSNRLDGWIDFNRDGDWSDPGEQIFNGVDLGTTNGVQPQAFLIPQATGGMVVAGTTYARFRVSTTGGLGVTGLAGDGEVEDYPVTIQVGTPASAFSLSPDNSDQLEGDSATTPFTFTVNRSGNTTGSASVDFAVTGTGANPAGADDFPAGLPSGTVNFADGESSQTITILVNGDTDIEPDQGFTVTLSNANSPNTIEGGPVEGVIRNDDSSTITVNVAPASVAEDSGGTMTYTFMRSGTTSETPALTINFATAGSATPGTDFSQSETSSVTFAAGQSVATVSVTPVADPDEEPNEEVTLTVLADPAYTVGTPAAATGTILNDDGDNEVSITLEPSRVLEDGPDDLVYTISRSGSTTSELTVGISITGTATPGTDFVSSATTSVTIPAGASSTTVDVNPSSDSIPEANETVFVTLLPDAQYTIAGPDTAVGVIEDEDSQQTVSVSAVDAVKLEGDSGITQFTFEVTRSGEMSEPLEIDYQIRGGGSTPADADDFGGTLPEGTISFPMEETEESVTISVTVDVSGDVLSEPDEDFFVHLFKRDADNVQLIFLDFESEFGGSNLPTSPLTRDGQTIFASASPGSSLSVGATGAGSENGLIHNQNSSPDSYAELEFDFEILSFDFFYTGLTDGEIRVEALDSHFNVVDSFFDADTSTDNPGGPVVLEGNAIRYIRFYDSGASEAIVSIDTVFIGYVEPTVNFAGGPAKGTILNDDLPEVSIDILSPVTVLEDGAANLNYTLSRTGNVSGPLTVNILTSGTADSVNDFTATSTTSVTFAAGSSTATITVDPTADSILEPDETVQISIVPDSTYLLGSQTSATGTIVNDDNASVTVEDVTVTEGGDMQFTVTLDNAVQGAFDVNVTFADGSATGGTDYANAGQTVNFLGNAGETQVVTVTTTDDNVLEGTEDFTVNLDATNPLVGDSDTATGTINDNDEASVTVEDVTVTEGGDMQFTVTLDNAVQGAFDVNVTFADGSATGGTDYANAGQTVNFLGNAGETQVFTVSTTDDNVLEGTEDFTVNLDATNPLVGDTDIATGTITDNDEASVTVEDITVTEGGDMQFTVTLDNAVQGAFDVNVTFADGSATGGTDFANAGQTVNFLGAAGETQVFTVSTTDDNVLEGTEDFTVNLDATNPLVGDTDTATGTITDNDEASVTVEDVTVTEGGALVFTVTLDNAVQNAFDVNVSFVDGSATGGTDYANAGQTVNFLGNAGETQVFTVSTTDDNVLEGTEDFTVNLDATNPLVGDTDTATGTITDNDEASVTVEDVTVTEGGALVFTVTLDNAVQNAFDVNVSFVDGSATGGTDYANAGQTVNFLGNAGETQVFTVSTTDDNILEGTEDFTVNLDATNPLVGDTDTATGTITDNDEASVTVEDVTVTEGGDMQFTVTLDNAVQGAFDVNVTFADGSATGGTDYANAGQTVNFLGNAGETQVFTVTTTDDNVLEGTEDFTVNLDTTNPLVGDTDTATGTITDNDEASVTVEDITVTEGGDMQFTVTLDNAVQGAFDVNVSFVDGSATGGTDYANAGQTVNFLGNAGETQVFTVTTTDDNVLEGTEDFTVNLDATNPLVGDSDTASGTITDNDEARLLIEDVSVLEGGDLEFTVTLDNAVQGGFTVNATPSDGSATGVQDYDNAVQVLTFAGTANESQSFTVTTVPDAILEGTETFFVALESSNVLIDDNDTATGTILDDDNASITIEDVTVAEGGTMTFTALLDAEVQSAFTVDIMFTDGTATAGDDFTAAPTQLSFAGSAGETQTFTVDTTVDSVSEGDETFFVSMTASNALVGDSDTATGTITDDGRAVLTISDATASEGDSIAFTVTLGSAVSEGFVVDVSFADLTATGSGTDYDSSTQQISFVGSAGESHTISVPTIEDAIVEPNEQFTASLSASSALVNDSDTAIGTIENDDQSTVSILLDPDEIGESDPGVLTYRFVRDNTSSETPALTVNFDTAGTATPGTDYQASASGSILFGMGQSEVLVTVDPSGDSVVEPDETVQLTLLSGNYTIGSSGGSATGTILDDDLSTVNVSVDPDAIEEDSPGVLTYTFTRDNVSSETPALTIDISTSGTATAGVDFSASATGNVTFAAGSDTATLTVNPTTDPTVEPDETVVVSISADASYNNGSSATATGTILNDDRSTIEVSVAPESTVEDSGGNLVYTFTRDNVSPESPALTVNFATGGSASSNDFTADASSTVTFAAGAATAAVNVTPTADTLVEPDETVELTIQPGSTYDVGTNSQATGTIEDDDASVIEVSVAPGSMLEDDPGVLNFMFTRSNTGLETPAQEVFYDLDGTATPGVDYTALPALSVMFAEGASTATVSVDPTADSIFEADETVEVSIRPGKGFTVGTNGSATGIILNDDAEPPTAEVESIIYFNEDPGAEAGFSPDSTGQRSIIRKIEIVFTGPVAIELGPVTDGSFVLESTFGASAGTQVGLEILSSEEIKGKQVVVLGFTGTTLIENISENVLGVDEMLEDGTYRLRIDGAALGIDANGTEPGVAAIDEFHRLFGDSDGDGDTDVTDYLSFRQYFFNGSLDELFNFDHDNEQSDLDDYFAFRDRYGRKVL